MVDFYSSIKFYRKVLKTYFKKFFTFAVFFLLFSSPIFAQEQKSIGLTPSSLSFNKFLRSSHYEQQFFLTFSRENQNSKIKIYKNNKEGSNWIKILPQDEFEIKAGQTDLKFTVSIDIPSNAEQKKYELKINIERISIQESSQIAVMTAVELPIKFEVTNEKVEDWEIRNAEIKNIKEVEPLKLVLKVNNKGNSAIVVPKVVVIIKDNSYQELKKFEENGKQSINAYETKDIEFVFKNHSLKSGEYIADIKVFDDNDLVKYSNSVIFIVFKSNAFFQNHLIGKSLIFLGIVILIFLLVFFFRKKKKNE